MAITRENFCQTTEGINQIKTILACHEDAKLSACSSLTTQWAGRPVSPEDRKRYRELIRRNKVPLAQAMARKLHALWRRHRQIDNPQARLDALEQQLDRNHDLDLERARNALKVAIKAAQNSNGSSQLAHPVFEPRIKELNGKYYDIANLPFSELPAKFQEMNQSYAHQVLRKYQDTDWTTRDTNYMTEIVGSGLRNRFKDELLQGLGRTAQEVAASELDTVRELAHESFANWLGLKSLNGLSGTTGSGIPFLAIVISQIRDASPVSCSQELGAPFITSERKDGLEGCKDIYEIKSNVLRFLDLSADQQLKLLALPNRRVCDFYWKLHQAFFEQPQFTRLQCHSGGFSLTGRWADGRTLEHKVIYHSSNGGNSNKSIRQVNLIGGSNWKPPVATPIEVEPNGEVTNFKSSSEIRGRTIASLRLYLMDAQSCCVSKDPRFSKTCLDAYNGKATPVEEASSTKLPEVPPLPPRRPRKHVR